MRVWDIPVKNLCNKHLIAQHYEIHCIYSIITNNKKGYASHPEVMRWKSCILPLAFKHNDTVEEMVARNMNHNNSIEPIHQESLEGLSQFVLYPAPWQSVEKQIELLKTKKCKCSTGG